MDIYYFLTNSNIDADELHRLSKSYNVSQYIYYCIYYTNILFPNDLFNKYLSVLKSDEGIELLNCFGLSKEEKHIWKMSFLERVTDNNFRYHFVKELTRDDLKKIEINSKYMAK